MVCVTAKRPDLDGEIDPRFGRAAYFVFVEPGGELTETVENNPAAHGAGVHAAQVVAERKPEAVITGAVGPNASGALQAAGIEVFTASGGTVREALTAYQAGSLPRVTGPTQRRHGGSRR
jgi:predicted Fe-Mo cluster-binding NifX family protein